MAALPTLPTLPTQTFSMCPGGVIIATFAYLDLFELASCSAVDRKCRSLASYDALWGKIFPTVVFPTGVPYKKYISERAVVSRGQLLQKVNEFLGRSHMHPLSIFRCSFPFNSPCQVQLISGKNLDNVKFDISYLDPSASYNPLLKYELAAKGLHNATFIFVRKFPLQSKENCIHIDSTHAGSILPAKSRVGFKVRVVGPSMRRYCPFECDELFYRIEKMCLAKIKLEARCVVQ